MSALPQLLPVLRLLGRDALLGLCYRALAADADPTQAQLSLRRIEHNAGEYTVAAQKRSQLRGALEIAQNHALNARREAQRLNLDLQLFNERYPPPPKKRGLFAPKRGPEQRARDTERGELEQQLALARQDADNMTAKAAELAQAAAKAEGLHQHLASEREELNARFRREVAAGVLALLALDEGEQAREVLAGGRRQLRGDLVLGSLWVLSGLFTDGPSAAARELKETHIIWEQHPDPVARVLDGLLRLVNGETLSRETLGIFPRDNFSHAGLWRLYLLLGALAGWPPPRGAEGAADLEPTLWAVWYCQTQAGAADWGLKHSPLELAQWAAEQDTVCRCIIASLLLRCGQVRYIPYAAGFSGLADIEPLHYIPRPKHKGERWPELLGLILRQPLPAWPLPLRKDWQAALAGHVLLAAEEFGPSELYEQWLEESRGWPPSNLHFWTQARLRGEPGILANLRDGSPGLFELQPG